MRLFDILIASGATDDVFGANKSQESILREQDTKFKKI
jgi:hypothetical protein